MAYAISSDDSSYLIDPNEIKKLEKQISACKNDRAISPNAKSKDPKQESLIDNYIAPRTSSITISLDRGTSWDHGNDLVSWAVLWVGAVATPLTLPALYESDYVSGVERTNGAALLFWKLSVTVGVLFPLAAVEARFVYWNFRSLFSLVACLLIAAAACCLLFWQVTALDGFSRARESRVVFASGLAPLVSIVHSPFGM